MIFHIFPLGRWRWFPAKPRLNARLRLPKLALWKVTTEAGIVFLMETQGRSRSRSESIPRSDLNSRRTLEWQVVFIDVFSIDMVWMIEWKSFYVNLNGIKTCWFHEAYESYANWICQGSEMALIGYACFETNHVMFGSGMVMGSYNSWWILTAFDDITKKYG